MGILKGFQPCHIGTLHFALCRNGFSGWIFWRPFFRWNLRFLLQKTHTKKNGEKFSGKFGENILFFGAFFGMFFGAFLVRFSVRNFLPRNRKNSRRIRSARENPLTSLLLSIREGEDEKSPNEVWHGTSSIHVYCSAPQSWKSCLVTQHCHPLIAL